MAKEFLDEAAQFLPVGAHPVIVGAAWVALPLPRRPGRLMDRTGAGRGNPGRPRRRPRPGPRPPGAHRKAASGDLAGVGVEVRVAGLRRPARSITLRVDEEAGLVPSLTLVVVIFVVFIRLEDVQKLLPEVLPPRSRHA